MVVAFVPRAWTTLGVMGDANQTNISLIFGAGYLGILLVGLIASGGSGVSVLFAV